MARGYFITAIGTDIGKTYVTACIARYLRGCRKGVALAKPVMSGYDPTDAAHSDAGVLLSALNVDICDASIDAISPWRFATPVSPHRAAELEGQTLDTDNIVWWCKEWLATQPDDACAFIEGVGGVMVPLTYEYTVLDWMKSLNIPVIIVLSDYLGAISHSLTALHILHQAQINVNAVLINQSNHAIESENTFKTLRLLSPYPNAIWATIPRDTMRILMQEGDMKAQDDVCMSEYKSFFNMIDTL